MIATLKTEILYSEFKINNTIEVERIGFDDVFNEDMYKVIGDNFWIPESDLKLLSK